MRYCPDAPLEPPAVTALDERITELWAELDALTDKRRGIDYDIAAVRAKLQELGEDA